MDARGSNDIEPLTKGLILRALKAAEIDYYLESSGEWGVAFDDFDLSFIALIQKGLLCVNVRPYRRVPARPESQFVARFFLNEWNRSYQSCLVACIDGDDIEEYEAPLYLAASMVCSSGVSIAQLKGFLECVIDAAEDFIEKFDAKVDAGWDND